jgi:hypothetical protein
VTHRGTKETVRKWKFSALSRSFTRGQILITPIIYYFSSKCEHILSGSKKKLLMNFEILQ